jgi:hypothetical protein
MSLWQIRRHQVCIAGRISEAGTVRAMPRVLVTIVDMPVGFRRKLEWQMRSSASSLDGRGRIDQTLTRDDGLFWFMDLPDGAYSLVAELPSRGSRLGKARATATVERDESGNVKIAHANFILSPTGLRGKVTGVGRKAGVAMAEVRVKGSGEYSLTDAEGAYLLTGIESGMRTVLVRAQGYKTLAEPVMLAQPGASHVLDFNLARETS